MKKFLYLLISFVLLFIYYIDRFIIALFPWMQTISFYEFMSRNDFILHAVIRVFVIEVTLILLL